MKQLKILKKLSGEKRLDIALELSDFIRELACSNIKEMLGEAATADKIQKKLYERLHP